MRQTYFGTPSVRWHGIIKDPGDLVEGSNMTPITIKDSKSLYHSNGDIVLLSLPKNDVVTAFKVDRVFLLRASPVFEGILNSGLSSPEEVESYDNVPSVDLQDEADHLTMFLKALYDLRYIPWKRHDSETVRAVEGILLLANKYQVVHLRERIVSVLERDWPSKLSDWDSNEVEMAAKAAEWSKANDEFTNYKDPIPDPCEVVRLARRCDVPRILPAAFYHLSRIRRSADHDSFYLSRDNMSMFGVSERYRRTANFSLLETEDLRCLTVGRDAMLHTVRGYLQSAFDEALSYSHVSSGLENCGQGLDKFKVQLELRIVRYYDDPLSLMKKDTDASLICTPHACAVCRAIFLNSLRSKREKLWELLPSLFLLKSKQ